jgi:hypothetical protein
MCVVATTGTAAYTASQLTNLTISKYSVPLQGAAAGTVVIDQASMGVMAVALTSSNPQVATVPSSVPIAPRTLQGAFVVTGASPGCATITAKLGTTTRVRHVVVHPPSTATALTLTVPDQFLLLGAQSTSAVIGYNLAAANATATLSSSSASVVSVPASVDIVRGRASFIMLPHAEGCATITARVGTQTVSKTVEVVYIGG